MQVRAHVRIDALAAVSSGHELGVSISREKDLSSIYSVMYNRRVILKIQIFIQMFSFLRRKTCIFMPDNKIV